MAPAGVALSLVLALAGGAHGDEPKARRLYRTGELAFSAGRFAEAARAFEDSYAASPQPRLLWNVAQSYRRLYEVDHQLEWLRRARAVFRNYEELAATEQERAEARAAGAQVAQRIAALEAARVVVTPSSRRAVLRSRAPGFAVGAVAVGAGAAALALTLLARSAAADVQAVAARMPPVDWAPWAEEDRRGRGYAIAADVLAALAGAALVIGVALLAVARPGTAP